MEGVPYQENNVYETNAKEPSKARKINGYSSSVVNKYQLTNNRMNLPIQKKPKLSFEAALFGELPTASSKRNNLVPERLEKVAIKKASRKVSLNIFLTLSILQKLHIIDVCAPLMVFQHCLYRMIQLLNVRFPLVKKGNRSKVRVLSMQNCHLNEK